MSSQRSEGLAVSSIDFRDRVRVSHMLLRLLDGERAEVRVCCDPLPSEDILDLDETTAAAAMDPSTPQPQRQAALRRLAALEAPATWTAIIGLDALPPDTRHVLSVAARIYEIDELDLSLSDGLEDLLRNLRDTTWTPEPASVSLH
ncbi:MAG: hypothetical protein K0Q76_3225 [Panacagrimonas sp.]|jgi:hypothetical protein|nr:hypothetical protein [Panacagrimonas sp.]MCC2658117.1 hypothetical protein [Panacagrimonas sp.]